MVRGAALTQEEVSQLAKDLISKGEKPTIGRIRDLLGNRGSPNTISRFLKNWREGEIDHIRQESEPMENPPRPLQVETLVPVLEVKPPPPPPVIEPVVISAPVLSASAPVPPAPHYRERPQRDDHKPRLHQTPRPQHGQGHHAPKPQHPHQNQNQNQNPNHVAHGNPHQKRDRPPVPRPVLNFEDSVPDVYVSENLDTLTTTQLIAKVRRLESILNKEVSRRERADLMARDAKEYAEAVKIQIGARINDIRQSMEMVIDSLQAQLKSMRENAEKDLRFYREALQKASEKLLNKS